MGINRNPIYPDSAILGRARISTANTNRDGTGTLATLLTALANGTRLDRIEVKATGTTTAGMVRVFTDDGADVRLLAEIPISAVTPSATVETAQGGWSPTVTTILPEGTLIKVGTHNAEEFDVHAIASQY